MAESTPATPSIDPCDVVEELGWKGWVVMGTLVVGFFLLIRDTAGPDFVMVGMLAVFMALRVVPIQCGLEGFQNEGLLTVAVLFVVAAGISETGGLDYFLAKALGSPSTLGVAYMRMMVPVGLISAFLNNTPVVAIMIPIISSWCQKTGLPPGQMFIPLSFASILGGTLTLIGTSTNLVVAGLLKEQGNALMTFSLTRAGYPVAVTGLIYIVIFARYLLPGGRQARQTMRRNTQTDDAAGDQFMVGLSVPRTSPAVDKSIEDAGLRGLDGLYIASVQRGSTTIHAVGPEFVVAGGDVLYFTGLVEKVQEVKERFRLALVTEETEDNDLMSPILGSPRQLQILTSPSIHGMSIRRPQQGPGAASSPRGVQTPILAPGMARSSFQNASVRNSQELEMVASPMKSGLVVRTSGSAEVEREMKSNDLVASAQLRPINVPQTTVMSPQYSISEFPQTQLVQARVKEGAEIVGKTIRRTGFREKFQAAVVSVQRAEQQFRGKLGDVVLQAGDMLLMDVAATFSAEDPTVTSNLTDIAATTQRPSQEFNIAMEIMNRSRLVGQTVEGAGLRGLPDMYLVAIERADGTTVHAAGPQEILREGDVLWFAGAVEAIASLRKIPGLQLYQDQASKLKAKRADRRLVQVVIAGRANMVGKTIRELRFRTKFDAAVIAVHRQGQRVRAKIGDIQLHAGDVLLLDTGPAFLAQHKRDRNFALVAEVENSSPPKFDKVAIACLSAVVIIVLATFSIGTDPLLNLVPGGLLASAVMMVFGCMSGERARQSVKWDVYVTIASAFGISNALRQTGAADAIAGVLVDMGEALGGQTTFMYLAIYIATVFLSNIVANNAAAALMFPISSKIAQQSEGKINPETMAFLLMLAASACFMSPFGYQTNLMVYGAGGYTTMDFIKFGGPMQVWQGVFSLLVIQFLDKWVIMWVLSTVALVLLVGWSQVGALVARFRRGKPGSEPDSAEKVQLGVSGANGSTDHNGADGLRRRNDAT